MNPDQNPQPASPWRRFAAMFYDSLLLFGLLFAATAVLLPFTAGSAIAPGNLFYSLYLSAVCFLFYGWCWTHGGQTLGMRAWKIRLQDRDGRSLSWLRSLARFAAAALSWLPLGFGYWCMLFDREKRTWHDRITHTRVIRTH